MYNNVCIFSLFPLFPLYLYLHIEPTHFESIIYIDHFRSISFTPDFYGTEYTIHPSIHPSTMSDDTIEHFAPESINTL